MTKRILSTICCGWLVTSCAAYHPKPLTDLAEPRQALDAGQIRIAASQIRHPYLPAIPFDLTDGLSPDEAAVLAIVKNPALRAVRDRHGIANAQLLQAGLLPNPSFSYNFAALDGGLDKGKITGLGLGLNWDITALLTQANKVEGAKAQQQAVDLEIAWLEWQFAQAAKLAVYQLTVYSQQQALLELTSQHIEENRQRIEQAAELGLLTEVDRVTANTTKNALSIRLKAVAQQKDRQWQRLKRALGLSPKQTVDLQPNIALEEAIHTPDYADLTQNLSRQRLDLLALQKGYRNQEQQVQIAVLQQFPKISIGFAQTRNNSAYYTLGGGISVSLPVFDQNQGAIALASATRQQLFDEYQNRLFQTKADIAELLVTLQSTKQQIVLVRQDIPELENLLKAYDLAFEHGQVDTQNYFTAWNNLTDKRIELLSLQLQAVETGIALEVATGRYRLAAI